MEGRLENKIKVENYIESKIADMPEYIIRFYYSINSKTHNTKERYIVNVIRFLKDYGNGNVPSLEEVNRVSAFDIQKYISKIKYYDKGDEVAELSDAAINCNLSSLSVFFRFLYSNGMIRKNPFDVGIDRPRVQEKDVIYLNAEEVRKVKKAILNGVGNELSVTKQQNWKYRDFCLFWFPVVNGIRVGALSEINVQDIDFNDRSVSVVEKGNRRVRIYFDEEAAMYLRMWMEKRARLLGDTKCDALFVSNRKQRMSVRSIEDIVAKYTENSIGRHISPHKLRATFATALYGKKRDIELVSKALHHKSTTPTQKYVKVFDQDIRDAVNSGLYY